MLRKKMQMYRVPLQQMKINYTVATTNKKVYTEEEDRFLLVMLDRYGIDSEGIFRQNQRRDTRVAALQVRLVLPQQNAGGDQQALHDATGPLS